MFSDVKDGLLENLYSKKQPAIYVNALSTNVRDGLSKAFDNINGLV